MNLDTTLERLRSADEDFEWYPTTDEIIDRAVTDMRVFATSSNRYSRDAVDSVLDIGAGDGRVLLKIRKQLEHCELMAIEKSTVHQEAMDKDIVIVGTDFHEQQLASKQVSVIFCNPPYSDFENWSEKIIREANAFAVYLVIPQRWATSERIKSAMKFRGVTAHVLGQFDFLDADRKARAKVELLRIRYADDRDEAYGKLFEEQFRELYDKFDALNVDPKSGKNVEEAGNDEEPPFIPGGKYRPFGQLKTGPHIPDQLVEFYTQESEVIVRNFQAMRSLDAEILRELGVAPKTIMTALKKRQEEIKAQYWRELFNRIEAITRRLTHESREQLLKRLNGQMQVDFTISNIYAVILWVIKNANAYMDEQLIKVYGNMIDAANVVNYKSNKRVFEQNQWRHMSESNSHFALDYRIVTHRFGGVRKWYDDGLTESSAKFLGDLCTLACNLGFKCDTQPAALVERNCRKNWKAGELEQFFFTRDGQREVLFEARAFLNGNIHLRFNKDFMLALNVEHGRLKGWIHTAKEAVDELQTAAAAKYFKTNIQIGYNAVNALTY